MTQHEHGHCEECWASLILRLAMASLFVGAVVPKFLGGVGNTVGYFQKTFEGSWLPMPLVTLHARWVPWIELALPIWLVIGWRLRWAWLATGLFLTSLAFGMVVAQQGDTAAHNYTLVLMACAGLYFSRFDRCSVDGLRKKKGGCCSG